MPRSCLSITTSEPGVTISSFPSARDLISTSRKRVKTSNGYQEEEKTSFWQIVRVSSSRRPRIFCRASSPGRDLLDQQRAKEIRDVRFLLDNRRPISTRALTLSQSRKLRRQILPRHVLPHIRPT